MPPLESLVVLSSSALIALAMVAAGLAWAWKGWLELQLHRSDQPAARTGELPAIGARIDLADMKERIRKLEAIAAGVEL